MQEVVHRPSHSLRESGRQVIEPEPPLAEIPVIPPREPAWGVADVLLIAIFGFFALIFCAFTGLALARLLPAFRGMNNTEIASDPTFIVPVQAIAYAVSFLFARMMITLRAQQDFWKAVRWNLPSPGNAFTYCFSGVVLALLLQIAGGYLPIPKSLPMDKYFTTPESIYLMMAFGILVAPLIEELLFRGLIFPVAVRHAGMVFGTAITALLFALLHQEQLAHAWAPLALLFFVGLALTTVRAVTRSVAASWIVHVSYNATLFALLFYATGGLKHLERM